ncbi:MAG TPA: hypothetical protein VFU11_02940 [Solirubrobacterales bacterium]|nr:hypothetical protein [Solirubrobacterales bacterium]
MPEPTQIKTLEQLWMVLSSGSGLLITDSSGTQVFHPHPAACHNVQERSFRVKVIANRNKNGAYFAVDSFEEAATRWPGATRCRSRACGGDMEPLAGDIDELPAEMLRTATGSDEVRKRTDPPVGAEVLMRDWSSTQRIALGERDGQLVLCAWPGELRSQARAFYGSDRAGRVRALIEREPAWVATPRPHLAFNGARRADRYYFSCPLPAPEYLARWSRPDDLRAAGGHAPESIVDELWPWLCERGYADPGDPAAEAELARFMSVLKRRRSQAHLRPGIELRRRCAESATELVRTLAETLREPLP